MGTPDLPAVAYPRPVAAKRRTVNVARFTASPDDKIRGAAYRLPSRSPFSLSIATVVAAGGAASAAAAAVGDEEVRLPVDTLYVPSAAARRRAAECPSMPAVKEGFYFPLEPGEEFEVTLHVAGGRCRALGGLLSREDHKEMSRARLAAKLLVDGKDLGKVVVVGSLKALPLSEKKFTFRGLLIKDANGVVTGMRRLRVAKTGAEYRCNGGSTSAEDAVGTIQVQAYLRYETEYDEVVAPPPLKRRRKSWTRPRVAATGDDGADDGGGEVGGVDHTGDGGNADGGSADGDSGEGGSGGGGSGEGGSGGGGRGDGDGGDGGSGDGASRNQSGGDGKSRGASGEQDGNVNNVGGKGAGNGKVAGEKPSAAPTASRAGSAQGQTSKKAPPRALITLGASPVILAEAMAGKDQTLCATAGTLLDATGKPVRQAEKSHKPGEDTAQQLPRGTGSAATAATPPAPARAGDGHQRVSNEGPRNVRRAPGDNSSGDTDGSAGASTDGEEESSSSEESSSDSDGDRAWKVETAAQRRKREAAELAARTQTFVKRWWRPEPSLCFTVYYRDPFFFRRNAFTDESGRPLYVSTRKYKTSAPVRGEASDDGDDDEVVVVGPGDPGYEEPPTKPSAIGYSADGSDVDSDSSMSDESEEGRGGGARSADGGTGRRRPRTTSAPGVQPSAGSARAPADGNDRQCRPPSAGTDGGEPPSGLADAPADGTGSRSDTPLTGVARSPRRGDASGRGAPLPSAAGQPRLAAVADAPNRGCASGSGTPTAVRAHTTPSTSSAGAADSDDGSSCEPPRAGLPSPPSRDDPFIKSEGELEEEEEDMDEEEP